MSGLAVRGLEGMSLKSILTFSQIVQYYEAFHLFLCSIYV